jgi:septal ring factor EnvC (AmiA/AmiB activator)
LVRITEKELQLQTVQEEVQCLKQEVVAVTSREASLAGNLESSKAAIKALEVQLYKSQVLAEETRKQLELRGERCTFAIIPPHVVDHAQHVFRLHELQANYQVRYL